MAGFDKRIQAMRDLLFSFQECPADQPADILAQASNVAAQLKGVADTEMLTRALTLESEEAV